MVQIGPVFVLGSDENVPLHRVCKLTARNCLSWISVNVSCVGRHCLTFWKFWKSSFDQINANNFLSISAKLVASFLIFVCMELC
jgi:hypothetical protein